MICRALFPCVAAIITAIAYHPTAGVSAFSTNAPTRLSTAAGAGGGALLKGAISSSPSSSTIGSALYATKKGTSSTKKEKSTTTKKSATAAAPKKKKPAEVEEKDDEVVKFKKADFVSALAEKTGMTKAQSDLALTATLNVIATEVADGKRISLPGLGTFKLNYRAARKGRNPASGEEIDIRALYVPSFSASKTFKDMCNPDR